MLSAHLMRLMLGWSIGGGLLGAALRLLLCPHLLVVRLLLLLLLLLRLHTGAHSRASGRGDDIRMSCDGHRGCWDRAA